MRDDDNRDDQEDNLRGRAQAPPAEHAADEGPAGRAVVKAGKEAGEASGDIRVLHTATVS